MASPSLYAGQMVRAGLHDRRRPPTAPAQPPATTVARSMPRPAQRPAPHRSHRDVGPALGVVTVVDQHGVAVIRDHNTGCIPEIVTSFPMVRVGYGLGTLGDGGALLH